MQPLCLCPFPGNVQRVRRLRLRRRHRALRRRRRRRCHVSPVRPSVAACGNHRCSLLPSSAGWGLLNSVGVSRAAAAGRQQRRRTKPESKLFEDASFPPSLPSSRWGRRGRSSLEGVSDRDQRRRRRRR